MEKQIAPQVHYVGVIDKDLKKFDIVMDTEGTTYNSYLIVDEKIALIDTVKESFFDEFIENVKGIVDPSRIDYIICQHLEPDHSGSVRKLLQYAVNAQVITSNSGKIFLSQQLNKEFPSLIVKDQETLSIGKKTLRFLSAPFLHWADVMFTWLADDNLLFSCDAFGAHFPDIEQAAYPGEPYFTEYYDAIMSPFSSHILKTIEKIKDLPIEILAPSHGPILRKDPDYFINKYYEYSKPREIRPYVVAAYASAYGYTNSLIQAAVEVLEENIETKVYNLETDSVSQIAQEISQAKAVLIGTPTFNQDAVHPVWDLVTSLSPIVNRGKPAVVFGSYGWSGEAVQLISNHLKGLKFDVLEGLRVQFKPTANDLSQAKIRARDLMGKIN